MRYLFLGGPSDGQRHGVQLVAHNPDVPADHVLTMDPKDQVGLGPDDAVITHTYLRRELRNGRRNSWFFYQHSDDKRNPAEAWEEFHGKGQT
jgi:hypothetical protein